MSEKERRKIVKAMESEDDFEEKLKEEGFSIYTTESKGTSKKKKENI